MVSDLSLRISELFYSIQGESTFAGLPCVFIRLTGCNLRCSYCDAAYTYNEAGKEMSLAEIVGYTDTYPQALVEITGGEPLLQHNVTPLMTALIARKRTVLLETNGSLPLTAIPPEVYVIVDVKCPGSGMATSWLSANIEAIQQRAARRTNSTEVKFVIRDMTDYQFAREFIRTHRLSDFAPILFSLVRGSMAIPRLAQAILDDELPVRLQVQLHTIIWPEISRGV